MFLRDFRILELRTLLNSVTSSISRKISFRMSADVIAFFWSLPGPAKREFREYIVPGQRGAQAQGARKSSGFRVKFCYRTITP